MAGKCGCSQTAVGAKEGFSLRVHRSRREVPFEVSGDGAGLGRSCRVGAAR